MQGLLLAAAGATLLFAFAAGLLFRRHRVPDIPLLLALGGLLTASGVVDADAVAQGMPFLAALALVMVLFDGSLEVTPESFRTHGRYGLRMALAAFTATTLLCGAVGYWAADLALPVAVLLGMCFGGAGIVIILPMARHLRVSREGMTVVLMEAVASDILVILLVSLTSTAIVAGLGASAGLPLLVALATGIVAAALGAVWGRVLTGRSMQNAYGVTLALLLLVYAGAEAIHGSGPLAVFAFGALVGRAFGKHRLRAPTAPDVGASLIDFHQEAMFFVRAFFFVGLGAVARWDLLLDPRFLFVGALLTAGVATGRALAVTGTLRGMGAWDRKVIALLHPMGLVTAAASILPQARGVPGSEILDEYAAVVIILTNLTAAVGVLLLRQSGSIGQSAS